MTVAGGLPAGGNLQSKGTNDEDQKDREGKQRESGHQGDQGREAGWQEVEPDRTAIQVLTGVGEPMNCKAMVEAMAKLRLWSSPGGATPEATLYASILRDINTKGKNARFKNVGRGEFALAK